MISDRMSYESVYLFCFLHWRFVLPRATEQNIDFHIDSHRTARLSKLRHRKAPNSESQAPHKHPPYPSVCSQIMALSGSQGRVLQKVLRRGVSK